MLRQKSRRGFLILLNKALFLKILTKKCQKSDFLQKLTFLALFGQNFQRPKSKKKKKKKKPLLDFCLNMFFKQFQHSSQSWLMQWPQFILDSKYNLKWRLWIEGDQLENYIINHKNSNKPLTTEIQYQNQCPVKETVLNVAYKVYVGGVTLFVQYG